jgi:phage-related tail fiber protein
MSDFRTYITQTGFGLERDAKFNNTQVDLAVLVVGDGVLPDSASPAEKTDLIHQVREYAITIERDEKDPNVWIARGEIPASDGGFFIKEAGIKTTDGELYSYARQAGDYKPLLEEGQGKSYTIRLKFVPGNADAIQIKIDPSVQFVTPTDLGNAVTAHVAEEDPHEQYQTKALAASQAIAEKKYADSLQNQKKLFDVSGTADAIVLTSKAGATLITELTDFDELSFIVSVTNTGLVTISIDGLGAVPLSGVVSDTQIFATALLTVRYIAGSLYIVSQINPKTGNSVLDIAKLYTDTVDVLAPGEYALDGSEINSFDHPIACAKAAASSNYIAQSTKDNDPIAYGGYYGFVDELDGSTTVTLPMVGGEFIRMFDDGRGVDSGRGFAEWKTHSLENHVHSHYDGQGVVQEYQLTAGNSGIYTSTYGPAATVPNSLNTGAVQTGNVGFETRPRSIAYYGKTRL